MNSILSGFNLEVYQTAVRGAMAAGEILKKNFHERLTIDREYEHDIKLEVDRITESAIIKVIEESFPDHSIISEEAGVKVKSGEYCWIIDPLDGSVNYYYNIPYFCTCIACYKTPSQTVQSIAHGKKINNMGEPFIGTVYSPITGDLYTATSGFGAYRNGVKIAAGNYKKIGDSMAILSAGGSQTVIDTMSPIIKVISEKARKVRIFGATGLDIINIATGNAGIFIQKGTNLWDFAASQVILTEAGGVISAEETVAGRWDIIATAPALFDEVEALIKAKGF